MSPGKPGLFQSWRRFEDRGEWRAVDHIDEIGDRVDASGILPDGSTFNGLDEFRAALVSSELFRLMLAEKMPSSVTADYDLRKDTALDLVMDAFVTLGRHGRGIIRVTGLPYGDAGEYIEIIFDESSLYQAMVTYSTNILTLSLILGAVSPLS